MRIDVKKFLFIGLASQKAEFFKKAQDFGIVHFISAGPSTAKVIPQDITDISQAIKVLRGLPVAEQEEMDDYTLTDNVAHKILELKATIEKLREEERIVRLEIARVNPFGDFSLEEIQEVEKKTDRKFQFYVAKQGFADSQLFT
jgi:V/A-type H+-transporting ATPase subunit I